MEVIELDIDFNNESLYGLFIVNMRVAYQYI